MAEFLVLQHVEPEEPGIIERAVQDRGHSLTRCRTFRDDPVPEQIGDYRGLVVMGGPMGVDDTEEYPVLNREKSLIADALERERSVLGVCLGCQLIADVLGAEVRPGPNPEIGWSPVELTEAGRQDPVLGSAPPTFPAFHWHGDVFELPDEAVGLARTDHAEHQAFRFGANVYGLLFHMEVERSIIVGMLEDFQDELENPETDIVQILQGTRRHLEELNSIARTVFGEWVDRAA